ncbi:NADH-quinone oxidoreductase subunit L [Tautonia plasticadhaerens]|uniref:NADH-quinone oxidoreductase subunit L n=1 Tax=Tautonia plasticadhaerens TaxID=2527974 RepID=A0A518H8H0_9BACT|nr:NADH-quinone oxidoreductase subunit L [Tautonia plasticadhaerens]QDV37147.1 NADH-quinone oxidoreductase subunit L [Tautonia plasticadhaerens]
MAESLIRNVWLIPLLPLLGGLIAFVGGRRLNGWNHIPVIAGIGLSFLLSTVILLGMEGATETEVYSWIGIEGQSDSPSPSASPDDPRDWSLAVPIEFRVDGLTIMMLGMVTFVASLVAIFAAGYMVGDPGYPRFFFVFGLFVFSMTGLVSSSNFLLTYAFWEGVGVCSYLLVGFWHAKPAAADAAKKAFMVNRVGDFGFAIALFILWTYAPNHDLSYSNILTLETRDLLAGTELFLGQSALFWVVVLLFWGATAKSAQIPLYVWLPDAMEGPTPVSALIHAATMVTAGVYLLARTSLLLAAEPGIQLVVAVIGCATALLAALIALTQTDLKRVLAYSTISQIGYMFMGIGAGVGHVAQFAIIAALFHLFTHAFFKALLFLGSGSVMHAMGGVIDMRRFSGLRHRLPFTHATFAIGALTLAGFPLLSGFFSKDEILAALKAASHDEHVANGGVYSGIYWLATLTALLTAFYTGRAYFLTFWGPEKLPSPDDPEAIVGDSHPGGGARATSDVAAYGVDTPAPESPDLARYEAAMGHHRTEVYVEPSGSEAAPGRPAGLTSPTEGTPHDPSPQSAHGHGHDDHHDGHDSHFGHESPPIMTVPLMVLAGCSILVGLVFGPTHWFAHLVEETATYELLEHGEHAFDWATAVTGSVAGLIGLGLAALMYARRTEIPAKISGAIRPLAKASLDKFYVDEAYAFVVVAPTRLLATVCRYFDVYVIDGLVRLVAYLPKLVGGDALRPIQNGLIQSYAVVTAMGVALLLIALMFVG